MRRSRLLPLALLAAALACGDDEPDVFTVDAEPNGTALVVENVPGYPGLRLELDLSSASPRVGDTLDLTMTLRNVGDTPLQVPWGWCGVELRALPGRAVPQSCRLIGGYFTLQAGAATASQYGQWVVAAPPGAYRPTLVAVTEPVVRVRFPVTVSPAP